MIEELKNAIINLKFDSNFPKLIQELKKLGIKRYQTWVEDGKTIYYTDENQIEFHPIYNTLEINPTLDLALFTSKLREHQQGKTDFATFCIDCSLAGVNKWIVEIDAMECIYKDIHDRTVLTEVIPAS